MIKCRSESGNVLFYILIAVALIAALSYAVSETSRGNTQQVSSEKAKLYASEILTYADIVSKAVAQLRLRGCDISELNFENTTVSGYVNSNAPSDDSCDIFNLGGGGVSWNIPDPAFLASTTAPDDAWGIYGGNEVESIGTTVTGDNGIDIILVLENVDTTVCTQLNSLLDVTNPSNNPPTDSGLDNDKFQGLFSYAETLGNEDSALDGQKAACYTDGGATLSSGQNVFYKVLAVR